MTYHRPHHLAFRLAALVRSERGISTVLIAMTMPAIMGIQALVIDGTHLYVERRGLQNAADAAALAAASYLPTTNAAALAMARADAVMYAALNGYEISPEDVVFTTDMDDNDRVTVHTQGGVNFFFASGFGTTFGAVSSRGAAQVGTADAIRGVMPWGIEEPPGGFVFGQSYCLKLGSNGGGGGCNDHIQGNFHAIDIDDSGTGSAAIYRAKIASGSSTKVRIGQIKSVMEGNMNGPTQQGTGCSGNSGRVSGNNSTFSQVVQTLDGGGYRVLDWTNTRLVVVPVVTFLNNESAVVTGFSIFFIETCQQNGAVTGRFVDTIVPGAEWTAGVGTSGARIVRLVQ
ncbi:MAG: pilus assembly protein TadG-related protein [Chloroflexi bacterium]|nr:pilus assembly protein TadG-related protein [Chloroflexota bacterium]MDA1240884.1 pilus assembly protein TadG-related protein [Chloroflexota bacterium]